MNDTKQALFFLVDRYADWEGAHLSSILNEQKDWTIKTVSAQTEVMTLGGFKTKVDYQFQDMPKDIDLLVLIGGESWHLDYNNLASFIVNCLNKKTIVGAICGSVDYLAKNGILNHHAHTGNSLVMWQEYANYTNPKNFIEKQAVQDKNLITANGTASLDFAELVLKAVGLDEATVETEIKLERLGYYQYSEKYGRPF